MSELILEAILKVLAIIAKADGLTHEERLVIARFLNQNVSDNKADYYLSLFDTFTQQSTAASEDELFRICQSINAELNLKQKIITIVRLIELALVDNKLSEIEETYLKIVCQAFNIELEGFTLLHDFINTQSPYVFNNSSVLVIDGFAPVPNQITKNLEVNHLTSPALVLRIELADIYLLKPFVEKDTLYLNDNILIDKHIYVIPQGSVFKSDATEPIFYSDISALFRRSTHVTPISFVAQNISYRFGNGKIGLHDINIAEESGNLVAIMGASGSGKSTLLNVLNTSLAPVSGSILLNSIDIHRQTAKVKSSIGFIPQDDLLIEQLSVYQNLYFAAKLSLAQYPETKIVEIVDQTINNLGLSEVRDLRVGNPLDKTISGGQRKRVNIGLELMRQPAVLFVDEPTSGLSSRDSENVMDLLRELCNQGKLIFVVIHQPSSDIFKMFDKLFVLDVGGYPIYYGNPIEGLRYFKSIANMLNKENGGCEECGNVNPEQIFNIIESKIVDEYGKITPNRKISPTRWHQLFTETIQPRQVEGVNTPLPNQNKKPGPLKQGLLFVQRDFLSKIRDNQYIAINLLQAPLLAFILGYVVRFYPTHEEAANGYYTFADNVNIPSYIFMSIVVALFMGLTLSAEEIIKDAKILKREAFLDLGKHSYLVSKLLLLFGFSAIQSMFFVLVGNWVVGIQGMFFYYWMMLFSVSCFANILGLNISATFKNVVTVYIIIPILLIPQMILGGIVVKFDELNPSLGQSGKSPWIADIITARWAYEGLMVSQFRDNQFETQYYALDATIARNEYICQRLYPRLIDKLNTCRDELAAPTKTPAFAADLKTLQHSFKALQTQDPLFYNYNWAYLNPSGFNINIEKATREILIRFNQKASDELLKWHTTKNVMIQKRTASPQARAIFRLEKEKYENTRVANILKNDGLQIAIIEHDDKLIQKSNPVFRAPMPTHWLDYRSHFFAPTKHFAGFYMNTFLFNTLVIWLMSFILYVTLYNNTFKKIISSLENLFENSKKE